MRSSNPYSRSKAAWASWMDSSSSSPGLMLGLLAEPRARSPSLASVLGAMAADVEQLEGEDGFWEEEFCYNRKPEIRDIRTVEGDRCRRLEEQKARRSIQKGGSLLRGRK